MYRRHAVVAGATVALAGCSDILAGPDPRKAEQLIRERINDERAAAGVPGVASAEALATAARDHSEDMAERDFYAHKTPEGAGPSDRAGCVAGENIHRGEIGEMRNVDGDKTYQTGDVQQLAAYVIEGWVLSQDHYELMTSQRWDRVGVGVAIVGGEFFATALFC